MLSSRSVFHLPLGKDTPLTNVLTLFLHLARPGGLGQISLGKIKR